MIKGEAMPIRFIYLLLTLFGAMACKHFVNDLDEAKLDCGKGLISDSSDHKIFRVFLQSGQQLQKDDFRVKNIGRDASENYTMTERGCLQVPLDGTWLIHSKDKSEYFILDTSKHETYEKIALSKAEDTLPTIQCPNQNVLRGDFGISLFLGADESQDLPYLFYSISTQEPAQQNLTTEPSSRRAIGNDKIFSNLKDGQYKIRISYEDILNEKKDDLTCDITIDSHPPVVMPKYEVISVGLRDKPAYDLISRDQLIRFGAEENENPIEIYYCFLNIQETNLSTPTNDTVCPKESVRITKLNEAVSPPDNQGIWELRSQAKDEAGNLSEWATPKVFAYVDTNIQRTILENGKPERLSFLWDNGLGLLTLVKQALSDYNLWKSTKTDIEKKLSSHGLLSSLYAAYIGYNLNGTVIAAPSKIDTVLLNKAGDTLFAGAHSGEVYKIDVRSGKIVGTFIEHHSGIGDMKLSSDESRLVISSFDSKTSIVEPTSMSLISRIHCCKGEFPKLAISPVDSTIVTSSWDNRVNIWSMGGDHIRTISSETSSDFHSDVIMGLGISSDGKVIYTASWDGTTKHWDLATGNFILQNEKKHTNGINSLSRIAENNTIASGSKDGSVLIHDAATGKFLRQTVIGSAINSLAGSTEGTLVVGAQDSSIRILDSLTGKEKQPPSKVEAFNMGSVSASSDGLVVASTTFSALIRIWNSSNLNFFTKTLRGHNTDSSIRTLLFKKNNGKLYSGASDGKIVRWDLEKMLADKSASAHSDTVYEIQEMKSGLVSFSKDKTIKTWSDDLENPQNIPNQSPDEWKYTGCYLEKLESLIYGTWNGRLAKIELPSSKDLLLNSSIGWVKVKCDDELAKVLVGTRAGSLIVYDSERLEKIRTLRGYSEAITGLALDPRDQKVFASLYDGNLSIKSLADDSSSTIRISNNILWDVKFDPNSQAILVGSNEGVLQIWNAETKSLLGFPIKAHSKALRTIAFSNDRTKIFTGSDDGTVKIWNIPLTSSPEVLKKIICDWIAPFRGESWFRNADGTTPSLCE